MTISTLSVQDFIENIDEMAAAAEKEPVFIGKHGRATHVLLNFSMYERLIREHRNMAQLLAVPDMAGIEFEPPRLRETPEPADLS
jgi:ligand-binding sensor protein